jgi:hypothetical protein
LREVLKLFINELLSIKLEAFLDIELSSMKLPVVDLWS